MQARSGSAARKKTPWQMRLEYLQSLSLGAIVEEINRERFSKLLSVLAAPSAQEKKTMTRLLKLYEADALRKLPGDLRASAPRMKRVLIGLHHQLGNHAVCVVDVPRLAANSEVEPDTCERAIRDLHDGKLIFGDRERERPRRSGGQGWSSYGIVWSTVADLALCHGAQRTLFNLPPPDAGALPQFAGAPPQFAGAPPQKCEANARADASFLAFYSELSSSSLSPSSPPDQLPHGTPSANVAEPRPAKSEQEKKTFFERDWDGAVAALMAYGVYPECLKGARSHGWSADQVLDLLDLCRIRSIATGRPGDEVRAWGPGLVFRHLQLAPAGSPICLGPSEAYLRAKRDQDLRLETARAMAEAQRSAAAAEAQDAAREEAGALLAQLSDEEASVLRDQVLARSPYLCKLVRRGVGDVLLREAMVKELKARAAETFSQEEPT